MRALALAIGVLLAAGAAPAVQAQTAVAPECSAPEGWSDIEALEPDFVVFGETHGSEQTPALVANLVCSLAMRGEPVLLAIEHSSVTNDDLQQAWAGPADELALALAQSGWQGREDGVASEAMLWLVQGAHRLKLAGYPVSIVAFNGARDDEQRARFAHLPAQGPHEAAQAENIAEAAAASTYDHVIVLVGNLHAQKQPVQIGGASFEPMAMRLSHYGEVVSLGMHSAGGETWNCQLRSDYELVPGEPITSDAVACGAYAFRGDGELDRGPHVALGPFPGGTLTDIYDGYFWVGDTTASPPAFAD